MAFSSIRPILLARLQTYGLLAAGLLLLCLPTLLELNKTLWQGDEQGSGPFIFAIILWLFYQARNNAVALVHRPANLSGGLLFALGLVFYIVGRSQEIWLFEVSAFIPLLSGILLMVSGPSALKKYGFAILFIIFLVPLPSFIIDALTGGLKTQVSHWAEVILYAADYPVARSGVMLVVGQYQLLVADACSGMNSMFSLFALGLLYIHTGGYGLSWRGVLLFVCVIPIAFIANVMRVIILILVTYHFGDAAGQGFIHSFAGMAVFAIALTAFFFADFLFGMFLFKQGKKR